MDQYLQAVVKNAQDQQNQIAQKCARECLSYVLSILLKAKITFEQPVSKKGFLAEVENYNKLIRYNQEELYLTFDNDFFPQNDVVDFIVIEVYKKEIEVSFNLDNRKKLTLEKEHIEKISAVIAHIRQQLAEHLRNFYTESQPEGYYEELARKMVLKDYVV